jgi:hypothetical protein
LEQLRNQNRFALADNLAMDNSGTSNNHHFLVRPITAATVIPHT